MWLELGRRIATIMLIVAIATGFAVPAVQAGSPQQGQFVVSIATSASSLVSCEHGNCPIGQNVVTHGNCSVNCPGASSLAPVTAVFHFNGAEDTVLPFLDRAMVERTIAPDLRPPKQI